MTKTLGPCRASGSRRDLGSDAVELVGNQRVDDVSRSVDDDDDADGLEEHLGRRVIKLDGDFMLHVVGCFLEVLEHEFSLDGGLYNPCKRCDFRMKLPSGEILKNANPCNYKS